MAYNLGIKPDKLKVYLYRDADFDSVLTRQDPSGGLASWGDPGVNIRLRFPLAFVDPADPLLGNLEWPAVLEPVLGADGQPVLVDGQQVLAHARFQVDKVETNKRSNGERVELWVGDQCWAAGTVSKKGVFA